MSTLMLHELRRQKDLKYNGIKLNIVSIHFFIKVQDDQGSLISQSGIELNRIVKNVTNSESLTQQNIQNLLKVKQNIEKFIFRITKSSGMIYQLLNLEDFIKEKFMQIRK